MIQRENQFTFGRARPPRKILGTVIGVMNELGAYPSWERETSNMTEEKVEEMVEEHAEALKIYDQEISPLKKRNAELEDKLERHLTDHKQDMVNQPKTSSAER
jgi:hypothetical protein